MHKGEPVEKQWRMLGRRLLNVIRLSVFAGLQFCKLGFYTSTETGKQEHDFGLLELP